MLQIYILHHSEKSHYSRPIYTLSSCPRFYESPDNDGAQSYCCEAGVVEDLLHITTSRGGGGGGREVKVGESGNT